MIDLYKSPSLNTLKELGEKDLLIEELFPSSKAALLFFIRSFSNKNILLFTSGEKEDRLFQDLSFFFKKNLFEFPGTTYEEESFFSPDIFGARLDVLKNLYSNKGPHIVLSSISSFFQKVINRNYIDLLFHTWKKDQKTDFSSIPDFFISLGYKRVSVVSDKNEFAVRGCIVDLFPSTEKLPVRIEFFGDTIDNIRFFDPGDQKTVKKIEEIRIPPASEKLFMDEAENFLDYLGKDTILVFDDIVKIEDELVLLKKYPNFHKEIESFQKIFFSKEKIENLSETKILKKENRFQEITFSLFNQNYSCIRFFSPIESLISYVSRHTDEEKIDLTNHSDLFKNTKNILVADNQSEEKHIKERAPSFHFQLEKGYLSSGFYINDLPLAVFSQVDFTKREKIHRQSYRTLSHTPLAEYHHLEVGDLVVHTHSGIGKYLGPEKIKNHEGIESEYLVMEFAKNSKLYVPLSQAHLISRYIGSSEAKPSLDVLGSGKWQKAKISAQKQILGYAAELLDFYAERSLREKEKIPEDSEEMKLFELDFPYEETPDQKKAISEIKKDLQSSKPMDRLLAGDVGYGKTEVAMRAAFKVAFDGKKQVALLVPTTILAMQHFENFKKRMSYFPIQIGILSRFQTAKENKKTLEELKNGTIDIIIGTHRLLSKDVFFHCLGLLIIDEEQRFGVKAKEHLKKLKKGIDCLSLSATPIPRTLYMSLIGVRDLSTINTPPQDRLPIKTVIAENREDLIEKALLKELFRGGQAYFIHNRVESIYLRKETIEKLIPKARISVVHGQMDAGQIDKIFHEFKTGNIDVLFATTIVENGIDVPNANTIIIDRADTYGLADLYQLRGRVGRWNKPAYAYFLVPFQREIQEISRKRLNALLETPGYGGGVKLAMRDLEIRGAGDLLGVKQSGQVAAIGFHLYCKLLKQATEGLKQKRTTTFIETKMEFSYPAYIPEEYISETHLRMEIYYRLGNLNTFKEIDNFFLELKDRFGPFSKPMTWLYHMTRIRIFASFNRFTQLKFGKYTLSAEQLKGKKKETKSILLPKNIKDPDLLEGFVLHRLSEFFPCEMPQATEH